MYQLLYILRRFKLQKSFMFFGKFFKKAFCPKKDRTLFFD